MNQVKKRFANRMLKSLFAFVCLVPSSVFAQDALHLTLPKAIEIAVAENPTIRIADKDVQLKEIADEEAWQNLLPTVTADLALQHSIKVAEIRTSMGTFKMGMDGTTTATGGLTAAIPLFAPAVYQNMKLTKEDIILAKEKANASRQSLANQVAKAYYAVLLAQDSYEVVKRGYEVAKENYDVIGQKFSVGKVSEYDLISAEVQMRSMSSTMTSTENGVKLSKLQLKVLMGITSDVDIVLDDNLRSYEMQMVLPEEINANDLENNTNIRQIDYSANLLQRANKILNTGFMPTIGAQLQGQYQSMSNPNWNVFNYHYSPSVTFALAVSIPVFKASNWTKIKTNKLQLSQLIDTRESTKRQLSLAAQSYRENMINTVAKIESNRKAVNQADKAVKIMQTRYDVGHGTVLELNQSETALTQAELTYNQSIYDYLINKADLDYTLGVNY